MRLIADVELPNARRSVALHTFGGVEIEPTCRLAIVQFDNESGFYLIRYGSRNQELTDTLHDTFADAKAQAEFEYGTLGAWGMKSI